MLQNFLKIYPKTITAQMFNGQVVVKLVYAVEQYGVFTGPFEMVVSYLPEKQAQDGNRWAIVSNSNQRDGSAFESFFKTLEVYLKDQAEINPLEEVRSGTKQSFEMYFPEMHCDLYKKSCGKEHQSQPTSGGRWSGAGLKRAINTLTRAEGFEPTLGLGLAH